MKLEILQLGNPILREIAKEVPINDIQSEKIQNYILAMKETMHAAPGVGLAAPQVGIPLQIIIIEDREEYMANMLPEIRKERERAPVPFHVIINPKLTIVSEENAIFYEGCLSVKGCSRITKRAKSVRVECLDEMGNEKMIQASGWYARILQHEVDHLLGKLYIDHADARSEVSIVSDEERKRWLNISSKEIEEFYKN